MAQKIVKNIQHITFKQLEEQLKLCVNSFNTCLINDGVTRYSVGLVIGKSQQWITSLAIENLELLPSSYFHLGRRGTILGISYKGENNWVPKNSINVGKIKEDELVIFDDCSYSGDQLIGNLCSINKNLKTKKKLYLVVPFMSKETKDYVDNIKLKKLDIKLITSDIRISAKTDIFNEEELEMLGNLCFTRSNGETLCYTDWRLPDSTSTLRLFSDKTGFPSMCKNGRTKLHQVEEEKGKIRPADIKKNYYQFIPTGIPRPYGLTKPQNG